ncbi:MAG: U32 family peptidase C-terminal domain-containing protein, partial [Clostridia bacterium]|nr:U32 family peptidase C-terminal domain-containing protein [Clostridia bacterium]
KVGDVLEVLSPTENFGKSFKVDQALADGEEVHDCKLVQKIYKINCPYELRKGDILRRRKL